MIDKLTEEIADETQLDAKAARDLDEMKEKREALRKSVSDDIAALLKKRYVTKADLARRMGTSRSNITQILKGDRNFTIDTLCDIASTMGLFVEITFKKHYSKKK